MSDDEIGEVSKQFNNTIVEIETIEWQCRYGSLENAKSKNFLCDTESQLFDDGDVVQYHWLLLTTPDKKYSVERKRRIIYDEEKMQCLKYIEEDGITYKIQYRLIDSETCIRYKIVDYDQKIVDASIIVRYPKKIILWTGNGSNGKNVWCDIALCMTDNAREIQNRANEIVKQQYKVIYEDNYSIFFEHK